MNLVVSVGDINGIGLECFFKSLSNLKIDLPIYLASNLELLIDYLNKTVCIFSQDGDFVIYENHKIKIINVVSDAKIQFGMLDEKSGLHAINSLKKSVEFIKNNSDSILLTLPITKKSMHLAGWDFPGHTEFIANEFNVKTPLMILFNSFMKVALATIHIPISKVAISINEELIEQISNIFASSLQNDFNIQIPNIAVLGLNPHSGENNSIGFEETQIIIPAIKKINIQNQSKFVLHGPFPADGFFAMHDYKKYDGIIAMYHDQGLIPLKMADYQNGVNFTAGLPIIRVSPDHGTALNIAGNGTADYHSTYAAIKSGIEIFNNRNKFRSII